MSIPSIRFGPFVIVDSGRALLRSGEVVPLASKALATLVVLVQAPGRVISKAELLDAVWPDSFVEEANLTQTISVLRKLFSADFADRSPIETIAKVGYRFRAPVAVEGGNLQRRASDVVAGDGGPGGISSTDIPQKPARRAGDLPTVLPSPAASFAAASRRRLAVPALVLLVVAGLTTSGVALYRRSLNGARRAHPRIAVLAFKNLSGSTDNAWLSSALRETLASDLGSDANLRVVPNENVERAEIELNLTRTDGLGADTLHRICRNLDCDEVVSGSYLIVGGKVRVDTHLLDARQGAVLGNYTATMSADDILPLINQTSSVMRKSFGDGPGPATAPGSVQATVSTNPEAYRLYIEGMERLRGSDGRAAVDLLERSTVLDPSFPLAHLQLSNAFTVLGQEDRASAEAHKAEALSSALSREEQLRIKARAQSADHHFDDAVATYRSLAAFYPDNLAYATELAAELSYAGHPQQCIDVLKPVLAQNTPAAHDPWRYSTLADCYGLLGDWPASLDWATRGAGESQRRDAKVFYERLLTSETQALFYMKQYPLALSRTQTALDIARQFNDTSGELRALNRLGQIDTAMNNLPAAQTALKQALGLEERLGEVQRHIRTLAALGSNLDKQADRPAAMAMFRRELTAAQFFNQPDFIAEAELDVAREQVRLGDLREGRANLHKVAEEATRLGDHELESETAKALAETGPKLR